MTETHAVVGMRERRLVATLVMVPAILGALCVVTVEAWRHYRPSSPYFNPHVRSSLAEAIAADDPKAAYEFIRAGADPNGPIEVRHPKLTGDRTLVVSPLVWAVATGSVSNVQMLLGFGGTAYAHNGRSVTCLAEAMGDDRIADVLRTYGRAPAAPCAENQRLVGPPLLWFIGAE
jgi:hypothetical protein